LGRGYFESPKSTNPTQATHEKPIKVTKKSPSNQPAEETLSTPPVLHSTRRLLSPSRRRSPGHPRLLLRCPGRSRLLAPASFCPPPASSARPATRACSSAAQAAAACSLLPPLSPPVPTRLLYLGRRRSPSHPHLLLGMQAARVAPPTRRAGPHHKPTKRRDLTRIAEAALCGQPASPSGAARTARKRIGQLAETDHGELIQSHPHSRF